MGTFGYKELVMTMSMIVDGKVGWSRIDRAMQ